jgi:membrane fusion protein, peptide pheromone/bacteriocin exporter
MGRMTPSSGLVPAELAPYTVQSLYADHGAQRAWIYWLVLGGAVGALAALPLVKVDVTVRAAGLVRPATERIELKAAVGGRVGRVSARDNEHAAAGQSLVELTARDLDERLARNRALQHEQSGLVADLQRLTAARREELATTADLEVVPSPESTAPLATPLLARELAHYAVQLEAGLLTLTKVRAVRDRIGLLAVRGLVTEQERDDAGYAVERAQSDRRLLIQQTMAGWQARLREAKTTLDTLISEERRLLEEQTLTVVRAPVAGTVQGLVGLAEGTYVLPGQLLGFISPDDRLVAEAYVLPRDIGLVRTGQRARMQVDAYPYTQWGLLEGEVESVAADSSANLNSTAAYKIVIRPAAMALFLRGGVRGALRKGMTLNARLVVTRRSLLQLLHEDLSGWLDPEGNGAAAP